ncbi:hypothetical protein [Embleya scabrispora]|uniref:hypothetical protein n=1 Tax=Embleya scabrispora TaxID=159449 RepID=UPI00191425EE|nr:hypothetical protein [Embleya scabrispora]
MGSALPVNRLGFFLNPNLFTVNGLTEWTFDGVTAWGEDHENFSAAEIRRHSRDWRPPLRRVTGGRIVGGSAGSCDVVHPTRA